MLWHSLGARFTFQDIKGKSQRLVDYRGKWVLVNFWATWCPPCQEETPDLIALHNAHKNSDLVVIGVALDSTRTAVQSSSQIRDTLSDKFSSYTTAETEVARLTHCQHPIFMTHQGNTGNFQEGIVSRADVEAFLFLKNKHPDQKAEK